MGGKIFVTILGLLLTQALAAILLGMVTNNALTEAIVAVAFAMAAISFMNRGASRRKRAAMPALLAFIVGFLNIVYLSFITASMWLVVMLCLDAAGFILTLDLLGQPVRRKKKFSPVHRKKILEKELPKREKPTVVVYKANAEKADKTAKKRVVKKKVDNATRKKVVKRATRRKATRRVTKKKTVKKTTTKKRIAKKKVPRRTIRRKTAKKR